jgi:hypothetical protein
LKCGRSSGRGEGGRGGEIASTRTVISPACVAF